MSSRRNTPMRLAKQRASEAKWDARLKEKDDEVSQELEGLTIEAEQTVDQHKNEDQGPWSNNSINLVVNSRTITSRDKHFRKT